MHIPDGILSAPVLATFGTASVASIALASRRAEAGTGARQIPLLGVLGAFVFAAQMVNFPVGPGASGHLLGAALLAVSIGPWAATVTMAAIVIIQALVFQDGGVLALAANVFNMAVAGVWCAWLPYRALARSGHTRLGVAAGAFLSVLVSAALALSQVIVSKAAFPVSLLALCFALFLLTALIEAAITVAAWEAIERIQGQSRPQAASRRTLWILSAAAAAVMAGVFFASSAPDVLEFFGQQAGIAAGAPAPSLFPDYEWKGLDAEWMRKGAAGMAGLLLVYAVSVMLARLAARTQNQPR